MVGGLNIVQWGTDKSGKSVQVGLSPGQTRGSVNGVTVTRPASQDVNTVYSPGVGSTSIKIDKDGNATTVKKDQYGNVVEVTQRGSSGNLIFQRKTTLYGGSVESGLPVSAGGMNVAGNVQDIQTQQENLAQYRKAAEYSKAQEVQQQVKQQPTPAFQLPGLSDLYQNRYVKPPKEKDYYAVQYPSGFGKVQLYSEYKPTDQFKLFGIIPVGKPEVGGLYQSDVLGSTKKIGSINQTEARELAAKPHKTTSVLDLKLYQVGNMLFFSPFAFGSMPAIKLPEIKMPKFSSKAQPKLVIKETPLLKSKMPEIKYPVIKSSIAAPKTSYQVALNKGAGSFAERYAASIKSNEATYSSTSRYRPTRTPKTENQFTAVKRMLSEEKAVSYIPTFERLKVQPQVQRRVQVLTQTRTRLKPMNVAPQPKTYFKTAWAVQTLGWTKILSKPMVKTIPETKTKTATQIKTITGTSTSLSSMIKTKPIVIPHVYIKSTPQIFQEIKVKTQPQTKTETKTKTATKTAVITRIPKVPIIKIPSIELPEFNLGTTSSKKKGLKYKKIKTKMLTLRDLLGK